MADFAETFMDADNCFLDGNYDLAISKYTQAISLARTDEAFQKSYRGRAASYANKGNVQQAIADHKMAADYGSEKSINQLKEAGVYYTPQRPSSSNGKVTFPDGSVWEGNLSNGQPDGNGKMTFTNGDVYEGFVSSVILPFGNNGKMTYANGKVEVGKYALREGFKKA